MSVRRILLAVTGLSPQVVTETLYALAVAAQPRWIPDEVHVITSATGAESLRLNLLHGTPSPDLAGTPKRQPGLGWFHQLRQDYALPHIAFDESHIHILKDGDGRNLDDIRTPAHNTATADQIIEWVRHYSQDPNNELHVSIAGGRKTMGYYLGYALSLFGRARDKLSHVLVSEPYESNREFYYPTPYSFPVHSQRGSAEITLDARNALVDLAEIPFVSLRHGLPDALLQGRSSFQATVDAARQLLAVPELVLDVARLRVRAGTCIFKLPPAQFAWLALLAQRRLEHLPALNAPLKTHADRAWSDEARALLLRAMGEGRVPDSVDQALSAGVTGDYFSQHLSRLRKSLHDHLGAAAAAYQVDDGGRPKRYFLRLNAREIRFDDIPDPVSA